MSKRILSKRILLSAVAGLAGLALAAGDAAAATKKKQAPQKPAPRSAVVRSAPRVNTSHVNTPHHTIQFRGARTVAHTNPGPSGTPRLHKFMGHGPGTGPSPQLSHVTSPQASHVMFKPGPAKIGPAIAKKPALPSIKLANNKIASIWKAPKKSIWVAGKWKVFVPFSAIGVVLVGGGYYWPDAYINVGRPYCEGITPDGCRLNWQMVNFEDGGGAYQCVQYCPRPNVPPPPQAAALIAPPPVPQGGACEVTVYSEPNLSGQDATTGDEQPALSQNGWQNQIASIQVKRGVWDFFSDENFAGNNMRLQPGTYQNLGPDWAKKINSFMCVMTVPPT